MARYNVTLPETIVKKLAEETKRQDIALSTLIAKYIEQYYKESPRPTSKPSCNNRAANVETPLNVSEMNAKSGHGSRSLNARVDYGRFALTMGSNLSQIGAHSAAIIEQFEA